MYIYIYIPVYAVCMHYNKFSKMKKSQTHDHTQTLPEPKEKKYNVHTQKPGEPINKTSKRLKKKGKQTSTQQQQQQQHTHTYLHTKITNIL